MGSGALTTPPGGAPQRRARGQTPRRRPATDARAFSESLYYRALADALPHLVWSAQPDGALDYLNERWREYVGTSDIGLGWTKWNEAVHPEDLPGIDAAWTEALRTGEPFEAEYRLQGPDGVYRWFLSRAVPIRDECGEIIRWLGTCTDIDAQKHAEQYIEDLRASEERFRTLCASSPVGIFVTDREGNCTYTNSACQQICGFSSEQAIGLGWLRFMHPEDRGQIGHRTAEENSRHGTKVADYRWVHSDGTIRWSTVRSAPLFDDAGQLSGYVGTIEDISESRRAAASEQAHKTELEKRVLERTRQLEALNRELETFAYTVSHDLRAPLRRLEGFVKMLRASQHNRLDEAGHHQLERVQASCANMTEMIEALLSLSRVARAEMQWICVDLTAIARSVIADCQATDPGREVHCSVQEELIVHGDARLLRAVMENLIGNAWKFTRPRAVATIEVGCAHAADGVAYFVRDNGVGFKPEYAGKLFGAFQRLHTSAEFEGTGIGLATVQRIIARHGGRVWAEGAVDKGATFYFTVSNALPITPL